MDPVVLTKAHSGIAILVMLFYLIRGGLMIANSPKARSVLLIAISHTLALVLLLLGLYTAHLKGFSFSDGFLISKITCFIGFILLGTISLKQGLGKPVAFALWFLGLATLAYAWMLGKGLVPAFF